VRDCPIDNQKQDPAISDLTLDSSHTPSSGRSVEFVGEAVSFLHIKWHASVEDTVLAHFVNLVEWREPD
jgi:hypothetical protein